MNDDNIKSIVENFDDDMFFGNIPKEEQVSRYVDAIRCEWQSLESNSYSITVGG